MHHFFRQHNIRQSLMAGDVSAFEKDLQHSLSFFFPAFNDFPA
jgi:hypothetical protein